MLNEPSLEGGRRMLKGTVSMFLAEALIVPTGFVTAVFLARYLGPAGYGLFALSASLVLWIEWLSSSVFTNATIKFVGENSDWKPFASIFIRLQLLLAISVAIALWSAAPLLSRLLNEPVLANYLKLFAMDIPIFCAASANRNILAGLGAFGQRAWVTAARWIARLVLILSFVMAGLSVNGAILGSIGASIIELGVSFFYVRPPLFLKSSIPLRGLWRFAAPLFMSALSLRFFRLDLFALKALGGTAAQAGFYSAAFNLSVPPALLSMSLSPALISTLSRLLREGRTSEAKEFASIALSSIFWLLPFGAIAAGASGEIVRFVFGRDFVTAGPIFAFLLFAGIALHAVNTAIAMLTATNNPMWSLKLTGFMVPIALLGHIFLIPRFFGLGAAFVTTCVAFISAAFSILAVYWTWGVAPSLRRAFNSIILSALGYALALLWPASGPFLVLKLLGISFLLALCLFALRDFSLRELALLRSAVNWKSNPNQCGNTANLMDE
jgi:O-antigen/teichoic acid export membrane protein